MSQVSQQTNRTGQQAVVSWEAAGNLLGLLLKSCIVIAFLGLMLLLLEITYR